MTTPAEQARTLRGAIERQRATEEAARQVAQDIERERFAAEATETPREE